jgi:hypothetical protein
MAGRTFTNVIARVYKNYGEPSAEEFRAMAVKGQGEIATNQKIAFQRPAEAGHGSLIRIAFVTEASRKGRSAFLVARGNRKGQCIDVLAVNESEANDWLAKNGLLGDLG